MTGEAKEVVEDTKELESLKVGMSELSGRKTSGSSIRRLGGGEGGDREGE